MPSQLKCKRVPSNACLRRIRSTVPVRFGEIASAGDTIRKLVDSLRRPVDFELLATRLEAVVVSAADFADSWAVFESRNDAHFQPSFSTGKQDQFATKLAREHCLASRSGRFEWEKSCAEIDTDCFVSSRCIPKEITRVQIPTIMSHGSKVRVSNPIAVRRCFSATASLRSNPDDPHVAKVSKLNPDISSQKRSSQPFAIAGLKPQHADKMVHLRIVRNRALSRLLKRKAENAENEDTSYFYLAKNALGLVYLCIGLYLLDVRVRMIYVYFLLVSRFSKGIFKSAVSKQSTGIGHVADSVPTVLQLLVPNTFSEICDPDEEERELKLYASYYLEELKRNAGYYNLSPGHLYQVCNGTTDDIDSVTNQVEALSSWFLETTSVVPPRLLQLRTTMLRIRSRRDELHGYGVGREM